MTLTRRRRVAFAITAAAGTLLAGAIALLAGDLYLHHRYERSAGFNAWGYRGPVVGRKAPGERRVVYLGGSTAFGYGVRWDEAIPSQLERALNDRRPAGPHVSVVNLGYNNEGAYSFKFTLDDFAYLGYDLACLYEGYNDLAGDERGPNLSVFRHDSPVFRATGYLPIFPLVFSEKAAALRYGGDVDAMYRARAGEKTVFKPGLADRAIAGALDAAVSASRSLEAQFGRVADAGAVRGGHEANGGPNDGQAARPAADAAASGDCPHPWTHYCRSIFAAVEDVLGRGKRVLVITQPYLAGSAGELQRAQQQAMSTSLVRRYGDNNPHVKYVNLGTAIDLNDRALAFDGMHLTAAGNLTIARRLVDPALLMARP